MNNTTNVTLQTLATLFLGLSVVLYKDNFWEAIAAGVLGVIAYAVYEVIPSKPTPSA